MSADPNDSRLIVYGIRYIVKNYFERRWTSADVAKAAAFYSTHNAGQTQYPFPRELFESIVTDHGGYFPVRLEALPEGTVAHAGIPVFQATRVTASNPALPLSPATALPR